jgi:hypothetical protein
MKGMMDMYQNAYRALPPAVSPFEFLQGHWGQPGANRDAGEQPPATGATPSKADEVDDLKRRIEELESSLAKRTPKKQRALKSAPKPKSRRKS